ncbi:major capsid protein, partial [Streptomyces sp. V2]|uniref:major capsid protein n=1 Tax=Streptomyces sp. V2 TaxID=1424099 RepID=UPI003204781A
MGVQAGQGGGVGVGRVQEEDAGGVGVPGAAAAGGFGEVALPGCLLYTSKKKKKKKKKNLVQGYLNIYNNYVKGPWMPDRPEANPSEINKDDARYGIRCFHLKKIW